jgi:hypothetical protein
MQPRMTIACDDHVAFIVSHGNASPSALKYPLWLRQPANTNDCGNTGGSHLRVIETAAADTAAL